MINEKKMISTNVLLLMTFSAVFSFPNIINSSIQIGLGTIPAYLFVAIFYFLPYTLMMAEFVSANKDSQSGIYSWIKTSLGDKWAYLGAWSYFFANLFFFTSLIPTTIIYLSYTLFGGNIFVGNNSTLIIAILGITLFWISTYISIKGLKWLSKVTNVAGVSKILMGILFIILAFIVVFIFNNESAQNFSIENVSPKFDWTFFMTMSIILQSVGGTESVGVYVNNTKGGNKNFIRTMIMSTIVVCGLYILGCVAIGLIVPWEILENNYSNGIFDVFSTLGSHFGISTIVVNRIVGLVLLLSNLGSLVIWTSSPVRVLFSEIPEGIFGKWICKLDKEGNPSNALIVQAMIVTVLLLIPALGIGSLDNFLETLINMTASTYLIPVLFLLIAYIVLRLKKDNIQRNFRMGNRFFGVFMGIFLLGIFMFVLFMSIVPDPSLVIDFLNGVLPKNEGNPILVFLYKILGLVVFLGFAFICWNKYVKNKDKNKAVS